MANQIPYRGANKYNIKPKSNRINKYLKKKKMCFFVIWDIYRKK